MTGTTPSPGAPCLVLFVMRRHNLLPDLACADYFARQHGAITRKQALGAGLTPRAIEMRLKAEKWNRVLPETFTLPGVPPSWKQRLMTACLWSGGLASHRSAASLWRLDGSRPGLVEITVRGRLGRPPAWIIPHSTTRFHAADLASVDAIPTTTIGRTLVDLGSVERVARVQAALDHALRDGAVSLSILHAHLERLGGRGCRGAGVLRGLLGDPELLHVPPASFFERKLIPHLSRLEIPDPVRQHPVYDKEGFIGCIDFAWPEVLLGLEADSWKHHSKRSDWVRDRRRRNRMTRAGWHILHATWDDAIHPERLADYVLTFFVARATL